MNFVLKFGRKKIIQETCVKFLGLLLDSHLSWKPHITELAKNLSRTVGLFYKIRHYAPEDIFQAFVLWYIFPISSVWYSCLGINLSYLL